MARVGKGVELDLDLQPGMSGSKQLKAYTHGRTCWRAAQSQHARSKYSTMNGGVEVSGMNSGLNALTGREPS